jgi:Flp pilus assembly protein CpaB
VRLHLFLRRFPLLYWAAAVSMAVLTAVFVGRVVSAAETRSTRFGALRTVPVVVRAVEAGSVIEPGSWESRAVPSALVPNGELAERPEDRTALVALAPGEVLLAAKVAPTGLRGVAALVGPGERALAVPLGAGTPPVSRGDTVDVLATFDPETAAAEPTFPVAVGARVLSRDDESVTVAVPARDAPRVAFAIAAGTVTLALGGDIGPVSGPESPRER